MSGKLFMYVTMYFWFQLFLDFAVFIFKLSNFVVEITLLLTLTEQN